MKKFIYEYPTKVYFGEGAVKEHLAAALAPYGINVLLAYGGAVITNEGKKTAPSDLVKRFLKALRGN